jgi:hypothetical protein
MSAVIRQDPWGVMPRLQDEINRLFGNARENDSSSATAMWIPLALGHGPSCVSPDSGRCHARTNNKSADDLPSVCKGEIIFVVRCGVCGGAAQQPQCSTRAGTDAAGSTRVYSHTAARILTHLSVIDLWARRLQSAQSTCP